MGKHFFLPLLALLGAILGILIVLWSQRPTPVPPILFPPPRSPYPNAIAATGIIESSSFNINIGSPFNELVTNLFVLEGDSVKTGDPLFQLDTRALLAQADVAQANLNLALIELEDKKKQYSFYERLHCASAVSEQQYSQAFFAFKEAEAGAEIKRADLNVTLTNIERSCVRSPLDGTILQVNIRPGQIAPTVPFVSDQATLMLIGNTSPLYVRVDIDEEDCWRYQKGAGATAFVRGNSCIHFPLKYVRIEPYIIPKSSFTGDNIERIDTRVLQALYSFEWQTLPIYPGLLLDIFIEACPIEEDIQRTQTTS